MSITVSTRNVFLGIHVTAQIKQAIREEAEYEGVPMSTFAFRLLQDGLRQRGYDIRTGEKKEK